MAHKEFENIDDLIQYYNTIYVTGIRARREWFVEECLFVRDVPTTREWALNSYKQAVKRFYDNK